MAAARTERCPAASSWRRSSSGTGRGCRLSAPMPADTTQRLEVSFRSDDVDCRAWLFEPAYKSAGSALLVILGHGLGATREMGLAPYAKRFAAEGIAALAFTYRHFGDSGGLPRQLLDIRRQLT